MRRRSLVLFYCLLAFSSQAWAGGDLCIRRGIAAQTGAALEDVSLATAGPPPLFVDLGAGVATGDRVTFEILLNGKPFLAEKVELFRDALAAPPEIEKIDFSAVPVVELLSANPARLAGVHRLARTEAVELRISRNGEVVKTLPFSEVAAASERLSQGPVLPFALRSAVSNAVERQPIAQKDECTQFCDDQQYNCYLNRCGQFGGPSCYAACDVEWIDCLENCGLCQPSSSSTTVLSFVSDTPLNIFECHTVFFNAGPKGIYRKIDRLAKRTVTTTTTNADCTQTVTTQVTFFHLVCWALQQPQNCFSLGLVERC
jgi:hypothetical protein